MEETEFRRCEGTFSYDGKRNDLKNVSMVFLEKEMTAGILRHRH